MFNEIIIHMLNPTGLGLLATSIGVDKKKSEEIVEKAAESVFGSDAGSKITKIISDQYKGGVKTFQIKNSIEELGVNLPRCPRCPDETVCSSKCKECVDRESYLSDLVKSKDDMNRDLQTRVSQVLEEYSPAQTARFEVLSEKIREQGDTITSLNSQIHELGACRTSIGEKDKEIAQLKIDGLNRDSLLSERNEAIAKLEVLVQQRDSDIESGKRIIEKTNDVVQELRSNNSSNVAGILQDHLEDLEKRDSVMKEISREKQSLESRVLDLDSRLSLSDSSNSSLLEEKKALESKVVGLVKSMEETSGRVLELDSTIISLTQQVSSRDKTIADMQEDAKVSDADMEQLRKDKSTLLELFEACDGDNKENVAHSRGIEADMIELREKYKNISDTHLESVNEFLRCDEEKDEQDLKIKKLEEELGVCRSTSGSSDEKMEKRMAAKEREIKLMIKDTKDKIESHEERLAFKSRQYSDAVSEKNMIEKKYSDLKKSVDANEDGMKKASSRVSEIEKEMDDLIEENRVKIIELTDRIDKENASHKNTSDLLNKKIYQSALIRASISTKLSMAESLLEDEKKRRERCAKSLDEKDEVISRLDGVIEEMKMKVSEDETFNRATKYIKEAPGKRIPSARFLNEEYANLFWIPGTGKSKHVRMILEPGGNGKVSPKDIFAFWNQAFKNFDSPGPRKIMVSTPFVNTPVSVSLSDNKAFQTWLRVRKGNSCIFEPTGTSNISKIYSKELLLWLYIVHLDGLLGDDGEELIPPGTEEDGSFSMSSFKLSDMFSW